MNLAKIRITIAKNAGFGEHPEEELWVGSEFESRNGRFGSMRVWECENVRENKGNCERKSGNNAVTDKKGNRRPDF